jgi:hypothetical protein
VNPEKARQGAAVSVRTGQKRRPWLLVGLLPALLALGWFGYAWLTFPSDRTPEGAYLRVVKAVNLGQPEQYFPYIETAAQHACFSIGDYRERSKVLVLEAYPEGDVQRQALSVLEPFASAPDGPQVFAAYAEREGWLADLRRDVSGIGHVEVQGERATVETVRGTRYAFRRRDNGIWGLTGYTPFLAEEAERAARDQERFAEAAADYRRVSSE